MNDPSRPACTALLYRIQILGTALFLFGGCGKEPGSAPSDTVDKPDNEIRAVDGNDTERESTERTPAEEAGKSQVEVDASAFLEHALNGNLESVRQAIAAGVDVDTTDEQQRTALLFASFNGHTPIVRLLLDKGAVLSKRDAMGRTALMFAATGDNAETVELLLENGAEVNAVDTGEGFSPLMHAAAEGQVEVVKVLLKHGADAAIRDADGDLARDFAMRNRHVEVVRLLTN